MRILISAATAVLVACWPAPAVHAGIMTAYEPVAVSDYSGGHAPQQSFGDIFTPLQDIVVVSLGYLDYEHDGLLEDHQVGIFRNSDQTLLVSTTLQAGMSGTLLGDFRYLDVAPTLLHAGVAYTIAGHTPAHLDVTGRTTVGGVNVDPAISIVAPANIFRLNSPQLQFPDEGFGSGEFYIGPNFRFMTAAEVPEPSTLTLFGLGVLGLRRFMDRRRRARPVPQRG